MRKRFIMFKIQLVNKLKTFLLSKQVKSMEEQHSLLNAEI